MKGIHIDMRNGYLEFYEKYRISPVRQDISNYELHCLRRKNLYRQLGIPLLAFNGSEILEVGAGSGHNALPYFTHGNAKHVDIVEPNSTGFNDIRKLFEDYSIDSDKYSCINCLLEDYNTDKLYDIVIAEGFVQHLENAVHILELLEKFTHRDSIIIITCSDEIGFYVEKTKRLVAQYLVKDIENFEEKTKKLVELFSPQLSALSGGGMSRLPEDWVKDQLLNPCVVCKHLLSLKEAINFYNDRFDVLGSSQNIFTDYSWYKDLKYDYKKSYMEQYDKKKVNFLFSSIQEENIISLEESEVLDAQICKVNALSRVIELENDWDLLKEFVSEVKILSEILNNKNLENYNNEVVTILNNIKENEINFKEYPYFFNSFGKTQQYISFVKK